MLKHVSEVKFASVLIWDVQPQNCEKISIFVARKVCYFLVPPFLDIILIHPSTSTASAYLNKHMVAPILSPEISLYQPVLNSDTWQMVLFLVQLQDNSHPFPSKQSNAKNSSQSGPSSGKAWPEKKYIVVYTMRCFRVQHTLISSQQPFNVRYLVKQSVLINFITVTNIQDI